MTNISNKSADKINAAIDVKMDELFNLFWEQTLNGIDKQKESLLTLPDCPQELLMDIFQNKSILMKKRFNEIEDLLKNEFKNRFTNEQWMDLNDATPIIPTKLSMIEDSYRDGFIITNYDIERNRRSFLKNFYFAQCDYNRVTSNWELFGTWFKCTFVYTLKQKSWNDPILFAKSMMQKIVNFGKTKTV